MSTPITPSELRQGITAIRRIASLHGETEKFESFLNDALHALDGGRDFAAYTKVANTALNIARTASSSDVRNALASIAFHAFSFCVNNSVGGRADFRPSRSDSEAIARDLGGPVAPVDALRLLHNVLSEAYEAENESTPQAGQIKNRTIENLENDALPSGGAAAALRTANYFEEAATLPLVERLSSHLKSWQMSLQESRSQEHAVAFERRVRRLLDMGEEGRQFGEFVLLDQDFAAIRPHLEHLSVPGRPTLVLERAHICRDLAPIEFRLADDVLFTASRHSWLVSAFWNSILTDLWPTNEEQFVYDVVGYLSVVQAEYRYAAYADDILILLRVSHLICRISSSEELVPTNFYRKFGRIETWVRYAVGTVLAISGPGRVPPSRVGHDPRFVDSNGNELDRAEFGGVLLSRWRSPEDREAAAAIILELTGWRLAGAERLIGTTLRQSAAEVEVWVEAVSQVALRASNVKVLRPNPWHSSGPGRIITADRHALAVLASDVIHRTFPSLDSTISLNGTSFRQRRVPTFLCSADFGPLGIFKVDSRDRIAREAINFVRYAQRLHPRYRASRCDRSVSNISEPDDRIEFVGGLLTSYVFTAREAPRSLNSWFLTSKENVVLDLVRELFYDALRPWYQHSKLGIVDMIAEYDLFSRSGLERLVSGIKGRGDIRQDEVDHRALTWLQRMVDWVTDGRSDADSVIEEHAAALQLCESLRSVTHGDLHMDNVLVLGKEGAEYPCLIDFETAGESHVLRDFGRFTGAVLFRTFDWEVAEVEQIRHGLNEFLSNGQWSNVDGVLDRTGKALRAIDLAWQAYVQYWRGTAQPARLELVASLACSFLPFARYPDTRSASAKLAISLAGDAVSMVWPRH